MKTILLNSLIFTLSLMMLTGCKIDGEEEITILKDGSGDIRVHFILPYKAFSKRDAAEVVTLLEEVTSRHPELSLIENSTCPYGKYCQQLKFHIGFESALELEPIILAEKAYFENHSEPTNKADSLEMVSALLGSIDADIHSDGISYSRRINLSPLFKEKVTNGAVLGDAEFRYILNTPIASDTNNAAQQTDITSRLEWTIPLKSYFNKPFTLQAKYAGGIFRSIWATLLILTASLLVGIYYLVKRRRSR